MTGDWTPPGLVFGLLLAILALVGFVSFAQFVGFEGPSTWALVLWVGFIATLTFMGFALTRYLGKRRGGEWIATDIWITTLTFSFLAGGATVLFVFFPYIIVAGFVFAIVFFVMNFMGEL